MDVIETLRNLLRSSAYIRDPAQALRVLPELALDLPPMVEVLSTSGTSERGVPTRAIDALSVPVTRAVLPLAEAALDGKPREDLQRLGLDRLLEDPLLPPLAELLAQSCVPGLRSSALPALAVARTSARLLGPGWPELREIEPTLAARASTVARRLAELPPATRAKALLDIAWGLRARLAATASLVAAAGWSARTGGLYRRVMADPLIFLFARGTLDVDLSLPLVASILSLPIEAEMAAGLEKAAAVALAGLWERRAKHKMTAGDESLIGLLAAESASTMPSVRDVLMDASAGPVLIAGLPDLAESRALAKAGLSKNVVAALGRREVTRALAASWRDLSGALLAWDILSTLVSRMIPVRTERGREVAPHGALSRDARWNLLVPRPLRPAIVNTVVAVQLAGPRGLASKTAEERGLPLLAGAADGAWARLTQENTDGLFQLTAHHGLGVFADPLTAVRFALRARSALMGPGTLPVGLLGEPLAIPRGVTVAVGVATGEVSGGSDGEAVSVDGPAVSAALMLTGVGAPTAESDDDPSGLRSARFGADGLRSAGVVVGQATLRALCAAVREQDMPLHVRGKGGTAGGVDDEFSLYAMMAWWQEPTGDAVLSALAISAEDGPAEILVRAPGAFQAMFKNDREAAVSSRATAAAFQSAGAPARSGPVASLSAPSSGFGGGASFGFAASGPPSPAAVFGGGFGASDPFGASPAAQAPAAEPMTDMRLGPPVSESLRQQPPRRHLADDDFLDMPDAPRAEDDDDPFGKTDTWIGGHDRPAEREGVGALPEIPSPAGEAASGDEFFADMDTFPDKSARAAPAALDGFDDIFGTTEAETGSFEPELSIEDDDGWGADPEADDPFADGTISTLEEGGAAQKWISLEEAEPALAAPAFDPAPPTVSTSAAQAAAPAPDSDEDIFGFGGAGPTQAGSVPRTENILELEAGASQFAFSQRAQAATGARHDEVLEALAAASGAAMLDAAGSTGFVLDDDSGSAHEHELGELPDLSFAEEESMGGTDPSVVAFALAAASAGSALDTFSGEDDDPPSVADFADWDSGSYVPETPGFAMLDESDGEQVADTSKLNPHGADFLTEDEEPIEASGDPLTFPPIMADLGMDPIPLDDDSWDRSASGATVHELVDDEFSEDGAAPLGFVPIEGMLGPEDAFTDFETGSFEIQESEDIDAMAPRQLGANSREPGPFSRSPGPISRPPAPPSVEPSRPVASTSSSSPALPDFGYLFQGYIEHRSAGKVLFGRRYAKLLIDAHTYKGMDRSAAYAAFLQDKVREGFVPRADLSCPAPPDDTCQALEHRLLIDAYRAMVGA